MSVVKGLSAERSTIKGVEPNLFSSGSGSSRFAVETQMAQKKLRHNLPHFCHNQKRETEVSLFY
ncbi:hypothetical protein BIY24_03705 [Halobacteriovorax marinus]|nr:hypothetical protein BIY24_03705 [Halobacteriovorax marinus]